MALEERGHKLYGLWLPKTETWDAPLNWQDVAFIHDVYEANPGLPMGFHFKKGPLTCLEHALWPQLVELLRGSGGRIFISPENKAWFDLAAGQFDADTTLILDRDLPEIEWMTDDWSPKLSGQDGQLHTVDAPSASCGGRRSRRRNCATVPGWRSSRKTPARPATSSPSTPTPTTS